MNIFDQVTRQRSHWFYLAVLFISVGAAFGLRWLLDPLLGEYQPFVFFYAAVVAVGVCGRWQYSVTAALLSLALAEFFFVPSWPARGMAISSITQLANAGAF